jgi:hypothetical protein
MNGYVDPAAACAYAGTPTNRNPLDLHHQSTVADQDAGCSP